MWSFLLKQLNLIIIFFIFSVNSIYSESVTEKIIRISDKVWQTSGTLISKPEIKVYDLEVNFKDIKTLIYYNPKENNIHISTGFAKLCLSISEDALAIALAHEIGHYFNLHKNTVSISGYYLTDNEVIILKEIGFEEKTNYYELETQADIFAAFHCLSSGYNIENAWDKLLDTIYSNVSDKELRQSINDRKKIVEFALTKVKSLQPIYKVAKYCYLIAEYEMAAHCYEYLILNNINSIEIYFNLANSYARAAISTDEQANRFIYPFEMKDFHLLDSNYSKIAESTAERGLSKQRVEIDDYKLLMQSKALLNYNYLLVQKRSQSPQLYLAISTLYNFAGETKSARSYLIKAEELSKTKYDSNLVQLTKGLIYMNIAPDLAELELSKADDFLPAKHNLDIIRNVKRKTTNKVKFLRINENFNGIDITNLQTKMSENDNKEFLIDNFTFRIKNYINNDIEAYRIENDYGQSLFIESLPNYKGQTIRNIHIGSSILNLKKQYGMPDNINYWVNSTYYIYNKSKIAFEIDDNLKIKSWFIFSNE